MRAATSQKLYHLADELRGVARQGLTYAQNDHDRERYERVLAASARIVAAIDTVEARSDEEAGSVLEVFRENLAHVSPADALSVFSFDSRRSRLRRALYNPSCPNPSRPRSGAARGCREQGVP